MDFERKSIKTEFEIEKWRSINGERRHSPILSLKDDEEKMSTLKTSNYYITLAKESPQRVFEDSDESTYDSYHCRETDVCRDSTDLDDSDSGSSSFNAIMEVVEYEIASIVGDEALYSNDSSSGSDDFFLTNITLRDVRQSRNYNSGFADTEGSYSSDNNYDPELSLADYWKCVKCKNRQNNPMFRYCEKCYQIRKSHFPPRPRRTNLKRKRNISPVTESIENSSLQQNDCQKSKTIECNNKSGMDNGKHNRHKKRKFNHSTHNNELSSISSYTETNSENCSTESSDTETENIFTRGGRDSRKRKIKESISYKNNNNINSSNNNDSSSSIIRNNSIILSEKERKKYSVEINDNFVNNVVNNTFSSAIKCNDLANSIPMLSQKDSGFSSTPSSQEIPSSSSQSDDIQLLTIHKYLKNDNGNSSDCDSVTDNLNKKNLNFKNIPINKSNNKEFNHISKSYTNLSNDEKFIKNSSNFSSLNPSNNSSENKNEIPSSSSTNKLNLIKRKDDLKSDINTIENDQCVVCLSEPKNGAFIHTKSAHICCCYRCAVKIWNTRKKCPICNCSVKNVLKLFVH